MKILGVDSWYLVLQARHISFGRCRKTRLCLCQVRDCPLCTEFSVHVKPALFEGLPDVTEEVRAIIRSLDWAGVSKGGRRRTVWKNGSGCKRGHCPQQGTNGVPCRTFRAFSWHSGWRQRPRAIGLLVVGAAWTLWWLTADSAAESPVRMLHQGVLAQAEARQVAPQGESEQGVEEMPPEEAEKPGVRRRGSPALIISFIVACVVVGSAGLVVWERIRRTKRAKAQRQAGQLLEAMKPSEALDVIRQGRKLGSDAQAKKVWAVLRARAYEQLGDLARLSALFVESKEAFQECEGAALMVARALLGSEQTEDLPALREAWRRREQARDAWLAFDADLLIQAGKAREALSLLSRCKFEGARDGGRLARAGYLRAREKPEEARALLAQATKVDPKNPDVWRFLGRAYEAAGRTKEAVEAFRTALMCAPQNPLVWDALADFYRRTGDHARALQTWCQRLAPPSTEFIWLRVLFWSRAALPVPVDFASLEPPRGGPLWPLVQFLLDLSREGFWNAGAFEPIGQHHAALVGRQEVYWLRLLEALRCGREEEALDLLTQNPFEGRSWQENLERALLIVLSLRRWGFLTPSQVRPLSKNAVPAARHPLFVTLDRWTRGEEKEIPPSFQQLFTSEEAFSACCFAAGWNEAGLLIRRHQNVPPGLPEWVPRDITQALQQNRGDPAARAFVKTAAATSHAS